MFMRSGAGAILILAALLRLLRSAARWDEWSLHYAAYNLPTLEALLGGNAIDAMGVWVGLHPPLYPLIHSAMNIAWPAPILWVAFSALASLGAVWLLLDAEPKSLLPALLLATDPVQLHYAAEVNNYPLGVFMIAYGWWAHRKQRPGHLTIALVLGFWTHLLAGMVILMVAMWNKHRWPIVGVALLFLAPLFGTWWDLGFDPGSRKQPPLHFERSVGDAIARFGIGWLVCIPLIFIGFSRAKVAAAAWSGTVALWFGLVGIGIAAPHQFPYAVFLGLPAAVLLAAAGQMRRPVNTLIWCLAVFRALWCFGADSARLGAIWADQDTWRGIDEVWNISLPGDAIVLVRGPGAPDDDKRQYSPTLWRIAPWQAMPPIFSSGRPDLAGQPRLVNGRRLYTFNHPLPAIGDIPGEHVFTILYDGAEQDPSRIPSHERQGDWTRTGPDLWRGPSIVSGSPADAEPMDGEIGASPLDPLPVE